MEKVKVKVENGLLAGEKKGSYMIFRGIPYAKPPVNELRFKAPQPLEKWEGTKECLRFGPMCPQPDMSQDPFWGKEFYNDSDYPLPKQSEDCLYLNIWAPAEKQPGGYPVAFWIHGGAFDHGFGSEMEFDGEAFARRNVILVTVNYRVGVFGFFAHEDLRREDVNKSVGNYGILDQIAALRWVRRNIEAFGGDSERITLFGQSAGAMSVQTLISSPLTQGMIQGAIMQSGGGLNNGLSKDRYPDDAYETGKKIMDLCHCTYMRELRKVSSDKLVSILPKLAEQTEGLAFGPVIDGWVMTEGYDECIEKDHIHDIPYIIGCTADDLFKQEDQDGKDTPLYQGCISFAENRDENANQPCYVYYFKKKLPGDDAGAFHSSELWYVFGTIDRCWRPMGRRDWMLSNLMLDMWTDFMKNQEPGGGWKAYTKENRFVRVFM
ncbi:MAG: carboxylesterase family protein [Erysipelotrichaceae bacterium]|nr:carboxylesterase family protein [Erysipelotrichaceae bacterium]